MSPIPRKRKPSKKQDETIAPTVGGLKSWINDVFLGENSCSSSLDGSTSREKTHGVSRDGGDKRGGGIIETSRKKKKKGKKRKEKERRRGPPECDSRRTISTKPPPRLKEWGARAEREREPLTTGLIFDFDQAAKIGSIVSRGVGAWPSQMNRNRTIWAVGLLNSVANEISAWLCAPVRFVPEW